MLPKKITLIDGNNWLRRLFSTEGEGSSLRAATMEVRTLAAMPETGVVCVWDGKGANKFRREIWPNYKVGRAKTPDGFYHQVDDFKRILKHLPVITIEIPEYEADDVIAALVQRFKADENPPQIHIKSTDKDFHQLPASYEGTELPCEKVETILYKCLVGDTSDKLPGIPGFGIKKFEALDKPSALTWLEEGFPVDKIPSMHEKLIDWCILNRSQLIAMRDVCKFRPVSDAQLDAHATFGDNNESAVEAIFAETLA